MSFVVPKLPKILFFFVDSVPTVEERIAVANLRGRVEHRCAKFIGDDDKPEPCDGVAGAIPLPYKKISTAEAAYKKYEDILKTLSKGDAKAPVLSEEDKKKAAEAAAAAKAAGNEGGIKPWPGGTKPAA